MKSFFPAFLLILLFMSCSTTDHYKEEVILFEEQFEIPNIDDVLEDYLLNGNSDNQTLSSLVYVLHKQLEFIQLLKKYEYNLDNQLLLLQSSREYNLEGNFHKLNDILVLLKHNKKNEAIHLIKNLILPPDSPDILKKAHHLLSSGLLESHPTTNPAQINHYLLTSIYFLLYTNKFISEDEFYSSENIISDYYRELKQKRFKNAYNTLKRNNLLTKPIYKEIIKIKNIESDSLRTIHKTFYNPAVLDILSDFYTAILKDVFRKYLEFSLPAIYSELDSTQRNSYFYYNLYLTHLISFGFDKEGITLLEILKTKTQTALQASIVENLLDIHSNPNTKNTDLREINLPDYHPFINNAVSALIIYETSRIYSNLHKQKIERLEKKISDTALNDSDREYARLLLGKTLVNINEFHLAMNILNYGIKHGFQVAHNDISTLAHLLIAVQGDRNQLTHCIWILNELYKPYPELYPLLEKTQFYIAAVKTK